MGIDKIKFEFIYKNVDTFDKKIMLELGNQKIKDDLKISVKTGKEFWSSFGCYHFSIDTNCEDGSMNIDLSKPIIYYDNFFDIVTNITVSNFIKECNICYDNIYRFCKPNGIIIHCLPYKKSKWTKTHSTNKQFYEKMALKYNMSLLDYDEYKKHKNGILTLAAFRK